MQVAIELERRNAYASRGRPHFECISSPVVAGCLKQLLRFHADRTVRSSQTLVLACLQYTSASESRIVSIGSRSNLPGLMQVTRLPSSCESKSSCR